MSLPTEQGSKILQQHIQANFFSSEELKLVELLQSLDQVHVFAKWPAVGEQNDEKKRFLKQLAQVEKDYLGGMETYVKRAKELLRLSAIGANPYEGYTVSEPEDSVRLEKPADFQHYESIGLKTAAHTGFILVAGGLGERLGYKGIKLALPSDITTETTFIELYIRNILALQERARRDTNDPNLILPLAIMTSDDTDKLTHELLKSNNNFGMPESQLTIFKQGKVPSLLDDQAHFCLEENDPFALDTKPHGHGDVHVLLYQTGLIEKFVKQLGVKYVVFFQDTNCLVFHALVAALGVSQEKQLEVNSVTVPRVQGDAVGAICKLERTGKQPDNVEPLPEKLTINVEYNQLEGLMGKGAKEPTVAGTNNSVYPGNINVLVFDAEAYFRVLQEKKGVMSEFVNPKYNADKKSFKKPTRLEQMMQDYPKLLDSKAKVGFSQFQRWTSFSAVKNAIADAAAKQKSGNAPEAAVTGEMEFYGWFNEILKQAGVKVEEPVEKTYAGITVKEPAHIILHPSVGVTQEEIISKFPGKGNISISQSSTLVVDGTNVMFESANINGAVFIRASPNAKVTVKNLNVNNKGWQFKPIEDESKVDQKYAVRGYVLAKTEQETYEFPEAGEFVLSDETKNKFVR
jgi:UDP-sugar pyrophosphorylase